MKKIFIILLCMITLNANATEMCARNDTVVIPLDATINHERFYADVIEWLWWDVYEYGTIYGNGACVSKKEMMMYSDWNGIGTNFPGRLNTSSDELVGSQGYYMNADTDPDIPDSEKPDYERRFVYVKLTHPMSSNWTYLYGYANASICVSSIFANSFQFNGFDFKQRLFNSIGTVPPWNE